ncbi:MAG: hypothetical protein ABSF18_01195, partial [Gammaproteobacteria bacterium]
MPIPAAAQQALQDTLSDFVNITINATTSQSASPSQTLGQEENNSGNSFSPSGNEILIALCALAVVMIGGGLYFWKTHATNTSATSALLRGSAGLRAPL